MNRLIIAGSPRGNGRTNSLAADLFESCIEDAPQDDLALVPLSEIAVEGCMGCGLCAQLAAGTAAGVEEALASWDADYQAASGEEQPQGEEAAAAATVTTSAGEEVPRRCAIVDDMVDVYEMLDAADELYLVTPVYFASVPSQLKALLDRLQPYYARIAAQRAQALEEGRTFRAGKKPAVLHVVGDGDNPFGIGALLATVQGPLACAGFKVDTVLDWVGCLTQDGDIEQDPKILQGKALADALQAVSSACSLAYVGDEWSDAALEEELDDDSPEAFELLEADAEEGARSGEERPQLFLNDTQMEERGRKSEEAGRSGGARGRSEKRRQKGGTQTNNRNQRKENRGKRKRAANAQQKGKPAGGQGSRGKQGGKGGAGKGGKRG